MNLFVSGMRRSGTTIAFDMLWEDRRLDCHFEPLRENRPTPGGGSGAHDYDFYEKIAEFRNAYLADRRRNLELDMFNYGAPRDGSLEFEADFNPLIEDYLRFILDHAPDTVVKCTRFSFKVAALARIDPKARFIHVIRDPRLVATSYLFGKNRKNRDKFSTVDLFFDRTTNYSAWSSYKFSELARELPENRHIQGDLTDLMRILLLWKSNFGNAHAQGQAAFGGRYMLLRHEDIMADPRSALGRIYDLIGKPIAQEVVAWSKENVRQHRNDYFAAKDPRWRQVFEELDMEKTIVDAGYSIDI